jgi:hypothetical protein
MMEQCLSFLHNDQASEAYLNMKSIFKVLKDKNAEKQNTLGLGIIIPIPVNKKAQIGNYDYRIETVLNKFT